MEDAGDALIHCIYCNTIDESFKGSWISKKDPNLGDTDPSSGGNLQKANPDLVIVSSKPVDPGAYSDKGMENVTCSPSKTMVYVTGDLSTLSFSKRACSIVTDPTTPMDTEDVEYQRSNPLGLEALRRRIDVGILGQRLGKVLL